MFVSSERLEEKSAFEEMTMTTKPEAGSAMIYQFPARGRFALGALAQDAASRSSEQATAPRVARIASGSGWYHDAAIEAERAGAK
jgi:uncharacterized protein DUF2735